MGQCSEATYEEIFGRMRVDRIIEIAIGLVFIGAAGLKLLDMEAFGVQIGYYGIVEGQGAIMTSAWFSIVSEVILGLLLILGVWMYGLVYAATVIMLIAYSSMVGYAWAVHGLADCGCFGEYIKMGPASTIGKNVLTLGLLVVSLEARHRRASSGFTPPPSKRARNIVSAIAGVSLLFVLVTGVVGKKPAGVEIDTDRPFASFEVVVEGQTYKLGEGTYIVALLSATCEHCQASVEVLNPVALMPDAPTVVSLMMGTEAQTEEFKMFTVPEFPIQPEDPVALMELMTTQAPPQIFLIRDGAVLADIKSEDPTLDEVMALVERAAKTE
jgi:hypothetical protein